jgi:hypothetical protein
VAVFVAVMVVEFVSVCQCVQVSVFQVMERAIDCALRESILM